MNRLAIVCSHPIQYYAPWFRWISEHEDVALHVYYLHDPDAAGGFDPGFGRAFKWDINLLEGYEYTFVPNWSIRPSPSTTFGLINPSLATTLARFKPDAVLAFGYGQLTLAALALLSPWPMIIRGDSHFLNGAPVRPTIRGYLRRRILTRACAHLSVGAANTAWLLAHGVDPSRIFHAPHAIDIERFRRDAALTPEKRETLRRRAGLDPNDICFGFSGKLEPRKCPMLLIDAFEDANLDHASLLLVGSGELEPDVDARCARNARIRRLPFVNQRAMPETLSMMDVLVLPSREETWGLVINEAQALGIPVIVSDRVGCHPDLVVDGETGWVFASSDRGALQSRIELAANTAVLARMQPNIRSLSDRFGFGEASAGLRQALDFVRR